MPDIRIKERFIRSLKGKEVDKIPVCSVTQTATVELMEMTGAKWPRAHYDLKKWQHWPSQVMKSQVWKPFATHSIALPFHRPLVAK